jgi:hypothetical protein
MISFLWSILVPQEPGNLAVTTSRAPCGALHTTVPWRDRLRHCCHHLSASQPSARCLTPWLWWTRALFAAPERRGHLQMDFGGTDHREKIVYNYLQRSITSIVSPSGGSFCINLQSVSWSIITLLLWNSKSLLPCSQDPTIGQLNLVWKFKSIFVRSVLVSPSSLYIQSGLTIWGFTTGNDYISYLPLAYYKSLIWSP